MRKPMIATAALAAVTLAACSGPTGRAIATSFRSEAGSVIDTGSFGNATMDNMMTQTGSQSYAVSLNRRFEAEVPTMVTFAFDSAVLDESAKAILREQARFIRAFPEVRFRVYGHTDLVGSAAYNQALGLRRANAVVNYLVSQGIDRSRLEAVVSFGETQPLIVTEGRERRNRRTVTEVSGFVERHPTVLNGKYAEIIFRDYVASAQATTGLSGIAGSEFGTEQ